MDQSNLDIPKIKQLFRDINIDRAEIGQPAIMPSQKVLTQAPGISPPIPPRARRNKYTPLQLEECVKLSRTVGTDTACKMMGVTKSMFYYFARTRAQVVGKEGKRRKQRLSKYRPDQLEKVARQALIWHSNTGKASTLRQCCLRAGVLMRINGHSAYNYYVEHRNEFGKVK
jgi:hypothetical protein